MHTHSQKHAHSRSHARTRARTHTHTHTHTQTVDFTSSARTLCSIPYITIPVITICGLLRTMWKNTAIFRCVGKLAKSDHLLQHVCQHGITHEIGYLNIFQKTVEKIQVSLNLDRNTRYFTGRQLLLNSS